MNDVGHTIRGTGAMGVSLTNHGTVLANVTGRTLLLQTGSKTSDGAMRALDGGVMDITAPLTNLGLAEVSTGGTFRAGNPSGNYAGGTLTGGEWFVHEGSTMRLIGADVQTLAASVLLDGPNSNLYRDKGAGIDEACFATRVVVNGRPTFDLALPQSGDAMVVLYDVAGRRVAEILDAALPRGRHTFQWSGLSGFGGRAPSGVYFAVAEIRMAGVTTERRARVLFLH